MPETPQKPPHMPKDQWDQLEHLMAQMRHDGTDRKDPMREIFARLGDRWSMLLLQILRTGPMRSGMLRRLTGDLSAEGRISQRILTLQLRLLEQDGPIVRTEIPTVPVSVDYALSPLGQSLLVEVDHVMTWIRRHRNDLVTPRASQGDSGHPICGQYNTAAKGSSLNGLFSPVNLEYAARKIQKMTERG